MKIILEPWGDVYEISVDGEVNVVGQFKEGEIDFEVNFVEANVAALWVPFDAEIICTNGILSKVG